MNRKYRTAYSVLNKVKYEEIIFSLYDAWYILSQELNSEKRGRRVVLENRSNFVIFRFNPLQIR